MPTIEEQKQKLRNKQQDVIPTNSYFSPNEVKALQSISHNAAVKQLLKDCKISAPANGDKTVVTKEVKARKSFRVITSKNYQIEITNLLGEVSYVEELDNILLQAKADGYITTKLVLVEETKEVDIQNYSYITKIKTDISTLQGVK